MKTLFTTGEVEKLCDLSYRQVQYWDASGFIKPTYRKGGRYRLYTFRDLVFLRLARRLRDADYSVQKLRHVLQSLDALLQSVTKPIGELTFLVEGDGILVFDGDLVLDSGRGNRGLMFRVRELREEVDALFPEGDAMLRAEVV